MRTLTGRLASLVYLVRPLALTFVGVVLISLGVAFILAWLYRTQPLPIFFYYITLPFLPSYVRGLLLMLLGGGVLAAGIWNLSGVVVVPLTGEAASDDHQIIVNYRANDLPRIAVLSGGAGMLVLSSLSEHARQITCITPPQDPVEYYYRASGLFQFDNVHYVVPTPEKLQVYAELDDGTTTNVMHIDHTPRLAERYVQRLFLRAEGAPPHSTDQRPGALPLTRPVRDAIQTADMIILGPGSLFESIVPNLLIDDLRTAVQKSSARTVYICNLMTEPGLTSGFGVGDHIRAIRTYGGFSPDYVLVNVQRIEPEIQQLYAVAHQAPVYLTPEEYEETIVPTSESVVRRQLMVEGSVVIEADLASSVVRYSASVGNPGASLAVRVLRHDPEKLTTALRQLLRRT